MSSSSTPSLILYIEAYSTEEFSPANPNFAAVKLTQSLIDRLRQLQQLVIEHKLSEVRESGGPQVWDQEDELRLSSEELVVTRNSFWFTGQFKHSEGSVETRMLGIDTALASYEADLQAGQKEAIAFFGSNEQWFRGLIEDYKASQEEQAED